MLNVPPGAMAPEVHAPPFATEVCVTESLFVHVTVPPTATVAGLGENAVVVSVDDPDTIETGVPVVLGEVVDGDDELHAEERVNTKIASAIRTNMTTSCVDRPQSRCPIVPRRNPRGATDPIAHELQSDELRTVPCSFRGR
jgi:hypothetical protein